jgi:nickel-dependent lactate racemase
LAADEAGFSRIAHGQYAIFIALRRKPSFKQQKVSNSLSKLFKTKKNKPKIKKGATAVAKKRSQYVFVSESQNYKVNFTMFITIKAVRNSCVLTM